MAGPLENNSLECFVGVSYMPQNRVGDEGARHSRKEGPVVLGCTSQQGNTFMEMLVRKTKYCASGHHF